MPRRPSRSRSSGEISSKQRRRTAGRGEKTKQSDRSKRGERRRRRNDRGQYVETISDQDILALLEDLPGPVVTTTDVAETFTMTTEGARRKLNDLCETGILDRRKSGQMRVYWRNQLEGNE